MSTKYIQKAPFKAPRTLTAKYSTTVKDHTTFSNIFTCIHKHLRKNSLKMGSFPERVFCCKSAGPVLVAGNVKLHNNPNRELHEEIFRSFLVFAVHRQELADFVEEEAKERKEETVRLLALICGSTNPDSDAHPPLATPPPPVRRVLQQTTPTFTPEALKNNPLNPLVPYVIHLTSRVNFGPVYSHRYFACPWNLQHDWVEMSLVHWFAAGEPFKMKAEKWDLKCEKDEHFFRLTLRPNLAMRPVAPTPVVGIDYSNSAEVAGVHYLYGAELQGGGGSKGY
jgi:hypothetical protein